jgi:hypothetical protein
MKFCILVLFCCHFSGGGRCTLEKNHPYVRYLTGTIFLSATCTLDETDKHFSHKLLLYFAFFVKWVKSLTYLRNAKVCKKVVYLF